MERQPFVSLVFLPKGVNAVWLAGLNNWYFRRGWKTINTQKILIFPQTPLTSTKYTLSKGYKNKKKIKNKERKHTLYTPKEVFQPDLNIQMHTPNSWGMMANVTHAPVFQQQSHAMVAFHPTSENEHTEGQAVWPGTNFRGCVAMEVLQKLYKQLIRNCTCVM